MINPMMKDIDKPVSRALLVGMVLSVVFMLVGVILLIAQPGSSFTTVLRPGQALSESLKFRAQGWLSLGILVLVITPVARVVMAIASFAWIKDKKYVLVSTGVLIAMLAGVLLEKG